MDWRERFRKLTALKQEYEGRITKERSELEANRRKLSPVVVRVCKVFARGLGWKYRTVTKGELYRLQRRESNAVGHTDYYIDVSVGNGVSIDFRWSSDTVDGDSTIASRSISSDEFTEERLADAIEDCYRARYER